MKRNDFILSLKQGFNMEHTLEPISVSRWPFIASLGGILRFIRYTMAQGSDACLECDILGIHSK